MPQAFQKFTDTQGDHLSAHMFGANGDGATNDTAALLSTLIPLGGDGSGIERLIPTGTYLVTPGSLLIPNPQSGSLIGQGQRFNTILKTNDTSNVAPILQLGDGTFEPHSYVVQWVTIDADGTASIPGALYLDRTNLMTLREVIVQNVGVNGIGIGTPSSPHLFGEMIFEKVKVYGTDGTIPAGSIGMQFYATGNVTLNACNVEQVETGVVLIGTQQSKFTCIGGHMERIPLYAFILSRTQPVIDCNVAVGAVWLDNDVVNGYLNLTNTSGQWATGGVVDNGFGNRIRKTSSKLFIPGPKASFAAGSSFDGDEWLRVQGLVDDPTFLSGVASWTGSGATLASSNISMPGVRAGKSIAITATGPSGFASRTFTATANTDYLLQIGLLAQGTDQYRIVVSNSGGSVYDSGNFGYNMTSGDEQAFVVRRQSIPVASDTQFTVSIYAVNNGQTTICSLLLVSQSQIKMNGNFSSAGTGFSASGSGISYTWNQTVGTGSVFSFKGTTLTNRGFVRAVVDCPAGVTGFIGIGGNINDLTSGPQIPLRPGVKCEYTIPVSSFPVNSTAVFSGVVGSGTLHITEVGLYVINDTELQLTSLPAGWIRADAQSGYEALSTDQERLWLGDNFEGNWQTPASAGNSFKRAIYASNIYWDEGSGLWQVPNNGGGDWAALILLNGGDIGFASEQGLTLPTTRTDAQVNAAVRFRIAATGGLVEFLNGASDWQFYWGAGAPTFSAGAAAMYGDTSNGVVYLDSGGTGWHSIAQLTAGLALLSPSTPVRSDSGGRLQTGAIDLSTPDVTGILTHSHLDGATLTLKEATGVSTTVLTYVTGGSIINSFTAGESLALSTNSTTVAVGLISVNHPVDHGLVMS